MKMLNFENMKGGWFIGDFEPTAYKTKDFEVSYKTHVKDEKWDHHYHTIVTEINLIISGEMILQGKTLKENDIFILEPYEIADPQFLKDTYIICVKTPSANDKKIIKT